VLASLLIFPAPFNYAAIAVVTLGDGFASIAGRLYGRNKIPYTGGKTVEGSAVGLVCAFAGAAIFVSPTTALIAATIGMTVELLQLRITDNLTVPLLSGLSISIIGNL
ncbi:MAG: phosphatidate cytidylyltransferase, partial [Thermoproteota archaeon]